jgi:hypothetical protein
MEKNQPRGQLGMLGRRETGQRGPDAGGDQHGPPSAASRPAEFLQALRVVLGPPGPVGPLAFPETDPIRRQHAVRGGKPRVNFRPLVRRGPRREIMQKNQRIALAAGVVNDLATRGALHAPRKNRRRDDVGQRGLRLGTSAQPQGDDRRSQQPGAEPHAQSFFPDRSHHAPRK